MPGIRIIGIGSPFGDDRLGWAAVEQLRQRPRFSGLPAGVVSIAAIDRPGALLLAEWQAAAHVILIDAVRSGAAAGALHRLEDAALVSSASLLSSHGFGLAAAIELAQALGNLPPWVVFGIEMDPAHTGPGLSDAVQASLPGLVSRVEEEASRLLPPLRATAVRGRRGRRSGRPIVP